MADSASRFSFTGFLIGTLLTAAAIAALYFAIVLNWSYSSGERAGWVQKFSNKGWLCKTWEGEIALVSMPGAIPEKFAFTVTDDAVAERINRHMGRRVSLHYEQKVGLPTTCFGETRYYVTRVTLVEEVPIAPGVVAPATPVPPGSPGQPPGAPSRPPAPAVPANPVPSPPAGSDPSGASGTSAIPAMPATPGLPSMPGTGPVPPPAGPAVPPAGSAGPVRP